MELHEVFTVAMHQFDNVHPDNFSLDFLFELHK